jgi:hypothetical protein
MFSFCLDNRSFIIMYISRDWSNLLQSEVLESFCIYNVHLPNLSFHTLFMQIVFCSTFFLLALSDSNVINSRANINIPQFLKLCSHFSTFSLLFTLNTFSFHVHQLSSVLSSLWFIPPNENFALVIEFFSTKNFISFFSNFLFFVGFFSI